MNNKDVEIYPVKIEYTEDEKKFIQKFDILPDVLPHQAFIMLIHAPPRSGKSVLILNLLYNEMFKMKDIYDKIIFISPTLENDKTLKHVLEDEDVIKYYDYKELQNINGIIGGILEHQKDNQQKENILIILDDCVGLIGNNSVELNRLCTRYRHNKISLIITSQNYKSFGVLMRNCASHYIFFKTNMLTELKKISDDMNNYPNFETHYRTATNKRYSFLYVNQLESKIYEKFGRILYDVEKDFQNNNNEHNPKENESNK